MPWIMGKFPRKGNFPMVSPRVNIFISKYIYILMFFIHYNVLNYQAGYVVVFRVIPCLRKATSSRQNLCMKSKTLFQLLLSGNTILILGDKVHCNQIETGSHLNNNGKGKPHFASLRENQVVYAWKRKYAYRLYLLSNGDHRLHVFGYTLKIVHPGIKLVN